MGDTATSVNQGGASGSTGIQRGGMQMRMAAAEARRVLVEMAAEKLGAAGRSAHRHRRRRARQERCGQEGELRRADRRRYFNVQLDWNKQMRQPALRARQGEAEERRREYKIVGKPIKREDVAPKVFCQEDYCTDIKVPGMVHGRMIRPAVAGAVPVKVDESSIKDIPGAQVVWEKGFLGVVADKEWDAIKAAQKLKVEWSEVKPPFPDQTALYDHIRKAPVRKREIDGKRDRQRRRGVQDRRARGRGRIRMAVPVARLHGTGLRAGRDQGRQGHLLDRLAEVALRRERRRRDARHAARARCARSGWSGPASYGRNDADDAAMDAGVLAKAVGKPVRLQYTRDEGTGWDPKGPASIHRARAAIDAHGNVIAYDFISKGFSRLDVQHERAASRPTRSPARLARRRRCKPVDGFGVPAEVLRVRQQAHGVGDDPAAARPRLAAAHRRICAIRSGRRSTSPANPSWTRWRRALDVDPVEFRLRHVKDAARHRGDQGRGREVRAGRRGPRRAATRPAARCRDAASPTRSATARVARSSPRSMSTARPARSGRASSPSRTTAARSSTRTVCVNTHRGQHRAGHQPHAVGGGQVRQQGGDQRRLDDLSDPRHHRDAGDDRHAC